MKRYEHKIFLWLFAVLMTSSLLVSCDGHKSHPQQEFASVQIQIDAASNNLAKAISTVNDITSVEVDIKNFWRTRF